MPKSHKKKVPHKRHHRRHHMGDPGPRKSLRRRSRGIMGQLVPSIPDVLYSGVGGAGYAVLRGLSDKFIPQEILSSVASAFVMHATGNLVLKDSRIGMGAIGAMASDITRSFGGDRLLSDYFGDYFRDNRISAPAGTVIIGTGKNRFALPTPGTVSRRMVPGRMPMGVGDTGGFGTSYGS